MKWETHIKIGKEVLKRLEISLTNEVYQSFKEGLIYPDKERAGYERHHSGKSAEIKAYLIEARMYFLKYSMV